MPRNISTHSTRHPSKISHWSLLDHRASVNAPWSIWSFRSTVTSLTVKSRIQLGTTAPTTRNPSKISTSFLRMSSWEWCRTESSLNTVRELRANTMARASLSLTASRPQAKFPSLRWTSMALSRSTGRLLRATSCSYTHLASTSCAVASETESRQSRSSKSESVRPFVRLRWQTTQFSSRTNSSTIRLMMLKISSSPLSRHFISRR